MRNYLIIIAALIGLTACVQLTQSSPELSITSNVVAPERIRFYGKGAGAGMMLSSSMGPMGIAVGVAIDEGIGKDIETTALQGGVNFTKLFEQKLREYIRNNNHYRNVNKIDVTIKRYGFISQSGSNDPVSAELKIDLQFGNTQPYTIDYPSIIKNKDGLPTQPLETIKTNAEAINLLFNNSIALALSTALKQ